MQEQVKRVMRFAGPRMLFRYPILAFYHLLDGRRNAALKPQCNAAIPDRTGAASVTEKQG